jgi:LacI family repressor for deo operon, udp, cdd, tsx, nupC, and nupG
VDAVPQRDELIDRLPDAPRAPTMADVARLAGVSTATVSHYLSGRPDLLARMGSDVRERVRSAVDALGYVNNKTARHLRIQRTERICVLLPQLGIPYADRIAKDVDDVARSRGYSAIIVTAQSLEEWRRVIAEVEGGLADGIIGDADGFTEEELADLFGDGSRLGKAHLVLHANADPKGFSVINYDRRSALRLALEHLGSSGRRRIAYLENITNRANPRAQMVRDYVAQSSDMQLVAMVQCASSRARAAEVARDLAGRPTRPDAILVESDFSAVTVIEELQRAGIDVPRDIAVIGCGNAEEGYYANPRLTTIGPTAISLAEPAAHLFDRIQNKAAVPPSRFVLPWTLIVRDSG